MGGGGGGGEGRVCLLSSKIATALFQHLGVLTNSSIKITW